MEGFGHVCFETFWEEYCVFGFENSVVYFKGLRLVGAFGQGVFVRTFLVIFFNKLLGVSAEENGRKRKQPRPSVGINSPSAVRRVGNDLFLVLRRQEVNLLEDR